MKHFTVTECYDSIPISDDEHSMTPLEADELSRYVNRTKLEPELIRITRSEVSFMNYVGYIKLSTCSIEVLPKVMGNDLAHSRKVLLRMLHRTRFMEIHESELGLLNYEKMNLLEIFAHLFVGKLINELNKGVHNSYCMQQEELHMVRGRIDLSRTIRSSFRKSTAVTCIYDEFLTDNAMNQYLKAAVRRVLTLTINLKTRTAASHALLYLNEVQDVYNYHTVGSSITFNRQNKRFLDCVRLARLILSDVSPISSAGQIKTTSILFKMNDLFEIYIDYLSRKIHKDVTIKDRTRKLLVRDDTKAGVFQLEPDLVFNRQNKPYVIVDTKWKRISSGYSRHGVQRDDFYQMYAYLTRYKEVETAILLYPHNDEVERSGTALEVWHLEENKEKKLKVCTINYEDEWRALEELKQLIQ